MFAAKDTLLTRPSAGGYQISRSLRFNTPDSTSLNKTFSTSGTSQTTCTLSFWVKRSEPVVNTQNIMFSSYDGSSGQDTQISFTLDSLKLVFGRGTSSSITTTQVFRDFSAWYHIVAVMDSTQATSSNRMKLYVNGSQITSFSSATYPSQNATCNWMSANANNRIGSSWDGSAPSNQYFTEINFIDGQALTPSSFGSTNADTGVWQPKAFAGTYGTNGFYLNFSDNSNTTAATLGKDYSGNGNNWTPNNFSVTAGVGNDSFVDVPTPYGIDTGVGGTVRGNYATLNPVEPVTGTLTYVNGNLQVTFGASSGASVPVGTFAVTSGKWYWEVVPTGTLANFIGVANANSATNALKAGGQSGGYYYYDTGQRYTPTSSGGAYGASYTTNDVIGVALDMDAGTVTMYKNNTSQGVMDSNLSGLTIQPAVNSGTSGAGVAYTCNFGQRPFAYTAPSGFKALCTQNLTTPTIGATTATQAGKYFNPVLYTGTGASLSVTGVGFQPDWVWAKGRSGATSNGLYDAVRGVQKQLISNSTAAETTETTGLTALGSDGFTVGALAQLNTSAATYVAWNWKANGSGSSNTSGTITSTVSASTTSGFSVVTYTGTGVAGTIGHGLGVAPSMIIVKSRSAAGAWPVYLSTLGNGSNLVLNTTAATATSSTIWNATSPTSSVFSVGINTDSNTVTVTYVAYCFAEIAGYSAFGSYTGNGSTDGPFVFTGMRPAFVMIKKSSSTSDWVICDAARNTSNVVDKVLYPDGAYVEDTTAALDFVSNGFKIRIGTNTEFNTSSSTYIYMALAQNPFKYSLAR